MYLLIFVENKSKTYQILRTDEILNILLLQVFNLENIINFLWNMPEENRMMFIEIKCFEKKLVLPEKKIKEN